MKMYKVTLCVLSLAIVLSLTSALPVRMERSSPSQDLTSKFDDLMTNFDEIKERVSSINEDNLKVILKQFNFTCRTFTSVMMLKLQLQEYLFDETENKTKVEDVVHKLTHLETAAANLNEIALQVTHFPCVVLAPEQYNIIYNETLTKANIEIDDQGQIIDILLHDMLDYAGDIVNLVTESIRNHS